MGPWRALALAAWVLFGAAPVATAEPVLRVFAAASLQEVVEGIAATGCCGTVTASYAGSGTLARQVLSGAPADVVLLADPRWMAELTKAGSVAAPVTFAGNRLILASRDAAPVALTLEALHARLGPSGKLAMGEPTSVPAGRHGQEALDALALWQPLRGKLVFADSVRGALTFALRGEVELALVYATDLRVASDLHKVADLPRPPAAVPIRYQAAVTAPGQGQAFVEALQTPEGRTLLSGLGFMSAPAE